MVRPTPVSLFGTSGMPGVFGAALAAALLLPLSDASALTEVPYSDARVTVQATTGTSDTDREIKTAADENPPTSNAANSQSDATSAASGMSQAAAPMPGSLAGTLKAVATVGATQAQAFPNAYTEATALYRAAYQVMGPGGPGTPVPLDMDIVLDGFLDVETPDALFIENPRTITARVALNVSVFASYSDYTCYVAEGCSGYESAVIWTGNTTIQRANFSTGDYVFRQTGSFVGTGVQTASATNDHWDVAIDETVPVGFMPQVGDEVIVVAALGTTASITNWDGILLHSTADFFDTFQFQPSSSDPDVSFAFVTIPEPAGLVLGLAALLGLAATRRRH